MDFFHKPRELPVTLFDEIECGLVVCDARGEIRYANRAARRELASACVLMLQEDVLRPVSGSANRLHDALRKAAQSGRRTLVRIGGGSDRLMVSVQPLRDQDGDTSDVLVMLGRRQACSELGLEMLASSFGLTLAERRVLAALVRGASPSEIAAAHAVRLSTVRTQTSSLRAKLGARNAEALLLRVAEMPPVASALRLAAGGDASSRA